MFDPKFAYPFTHSLHVSGVSKFHPSKSGDDPATGIPVTKLGQPFRKYRCQPDFDHADYNTQNIVLCKIYYAGPHLQGRGQSCDKFEQVSTAPSYRAPAYRAPAYRAPAARAASTRGRFGIIGA